MCLQGVKAPLLQLIRIARIERALLSVTVDLAGGASMEVAG
jgi:hypothetical protein